MTCTSAHSFGFLSLVYFPLSLFFSFQDFLYTLGGNRIYRQVLIDVYTLEHLHHFTFFSRWRFEEKNYVWRKVASCVFILFLLACI